MVHSMEPFSLIVARDGRRIGILEVGSPQGKPVFHFHGSGSSRLEVLMLAEAASRNGVRLIGVDRPGVGRTDPTQNDALLDWPDTVIDVADALNIERFAVQGMSAGGPYALACAHRTPSRLTACGLIASVPPPDMMIKAGPAFMRAIWRLGRRFPKMFQAYLKIAVADTTPDAARMAKRIRRWSSFAAEADRPFLASPDTSGALARALAENLRQGPAAARREVPIELNWGFDPVQISFSPIHLWHGEKDRIMPVAPARLLAAALPGCHASFYPTDGHFSVLLNHADDILRTLATG